MCTGDHAIRIAILCDLASAFRHHGGPTYNIFHFSSRRSIFAPTSFLAGLPDAVDVFIPGRKSRGTSGIRRPPCEISVTMVRVA